MSTEACGASSGTGRDSGTHLQSVDALYQGFSADESATSSAFGIFKHSAAFSSNEASSSAASRTQPPGGSSGFHRFIPAIHLRSVCSAPSLDDNANYHANCDADNATNRTADCSHTEKATLRTHPSVLGMWLSSRVLVLIGL